MTTVPCPICGEDTFTGHVYSDSDCGVIGATARTTTTTLVAAERLDYVALNNR